MGLVKVAALYLGTVMLKARVAPGFDVPGADEIATGVVAQATGLPGKLFLGVGIAKLAASFAAGQIGGAGIGGGGIEFLQ